MSDCKNALDELVTFIKEHETIEHVEEMDLYDAERIHDIKNLFKEEEKIMTDANEVPKGDMIYHSNRSFDFLYAIIDGTKLLVVEVQEDLSSGENCGVFYELYPNADKMTVSVVHGHQDNQYLIITNDRGRKISSYDFEKAHHKYPLVKNAKLSEFVLSVSSQELEDRLQEQMKLTLS